MGSESSKPVSSTGKRHSRRLSIGSNGDPNLAQNGAANGNRCALSSNNISTLPAAISKFGTSNSCNENLLGAGLSQQETRSRSGSASGPGKQKKSPIILKNRQLIQSCFQNPHENLGKRILKRTAEKRKDFARFYMALNYEQKDDIEETIKTLLKKCVANIEFIDEVQRLASEFGGHFVKYRQIGFKADYFATIGDATITECVFLDNAVHQAHQTLSAFSQFIAMLLSSVRDGFYNEMKRLRRTSNSFSTGSNGSNGGNERKTAPGSCDVSPRSASPAAESSTNAGETKATATTRQQGNSRDSSLHEEQDEEIKDAEKEYVTMAKATDEGTESPKKEIEQGQPDVQKLMRAEAALNCDTVVRESRTVTFQCAELDTRAVPAKKSFSKEPKENCGSEKENIVPKEKYHDVDTSDKIDGNQEENSQSESKDTTALDSVPSSTTDESAETEMGDDKSAKSPPERNIVSANVLQDNSAHRKSLLPPSVAAIFNDS